MRNLLLDPLCRAEDLGTPIPPTPYGISVCLPLWEDIVGYEEKDPRVIKKMHNGYPRFFIPSTIERLIKVVEKKCAKANERALIFPRRIHAERCAEFVRPRGGSAHVTEYGKERLGVVVFASDSYDTARLYWRFCGEIISIRQAQNALNQVDTTQDDVAPRGGSESRVIKERLATLAGCGVEDVFLFPSGMAAAFAVHRMLTTCFPSRKTVQLDFPYVDTLKIQQYFGWGVHFFPFVDDDDYERLHKIIQTESLAGIFVEIPSNPLLTCIDMCRIVEMMSIEKQKIPIVLDDTVATSVNINAFLVADVVLTSLSKAFSGSGDVLAGSVMLNRDSEYYSAFWSFLNDHNDNELWWGDAVVLEKNSRDFVERARIMSKNGAALYSFLRDHPAIQKVHYSMNDTVGAHEYFLKPRGGHSFLLSFLLKDASKTPKFYDILEFCKGPSLGTNFTLVCPYTLLAHYDELEWAESCGIDRNLIRVSCGLEPQEAIAGRMKRALDSL